MCSFDGSRIVTDSRFVPICCNRLLEECGDLDAAILRLLTQALARELSIDLFGFDVLLESGTRNIFVVDVNVLPGFKGEAGQ